MKKKSETPKLKLPCFRDAGSKLDPPELNMDDYYKAVIMINQAMKCHSESPASGSARFVIREEDEKYFSKKKS